MKLANKAYVVTLILLMLVFAAPAQKSDKDDRNTAPTVGTGGPVGGPTGLFTVYDASTLRKGEYTLSAALSNYDRDPGNVDISSVPLSFQIGLSNRFELFFTTEGYRGVKVNSPRNLSSFYLPNSQFRVGTSPVLTRPPAIVLEPGTGTRAIFRPAGAPFTSFPFTGPFFAPNLIGTGTTLGPPRAGGGADLFPGVGSVFGSILPGIVLSTSTLASGATVPASFTSAPTYLPDAPFINRTWGTSSFNSMVLGAKWRFNDSMSKAGWGVTGFYRWYMDSADDAAGFNMMQRGSGPGSGGRWRGDAGLTLFADARVATWANVSGNVGYVFTSRTKGDIGGGRDVTLLDRPDEFQWSVGADFPVNRFFQPILEFRSLTYVGGRTPNVLEQDPIDGIAGFRVYPARWFGFGVAYRHNFNQQDADYFKDFRRTNAVTVLCPAGAPANCVPSTTTVTSTGVPPGLVTSSDPHGYIAQFWIGRRDKREGERINIPANVDSVTLSDTTITLPCPPGTQSRSNACNDNSTISVATRASDAENDVLTYNYTVSGGRIVGTGANVQWDLSTAQAGTYTITTGVDDGCGFCGRTDTQTITIAACPDCFTPDRCSCPNLTISGPAGITSPGDAMTFTANVSGGENTTYDWTVTAGTIESGQGTPSIRVRTTSDMAGSNVTATVRIGGTDPACSCDIDASDTAGVAGIIDNITFDEFGTLSNDDVRGRIDNFFIQLNNNPGAQGYVINYGTAAEIRRRNALINNHIRMRGYDPSRITFIDGPRDGTGIRTKLVISPSGAPQVTP
ncbi:hypothetical protein BH20ACI2_BH20ACI2_24960 [soil metagenome]